MTDRIKIRENRGLWTVYDLLHGKYPTQVLYFSLLYLCTFKKQYTWRWCHENWCCRGNNKHKLQKKDEARDKWELKCNEVTLCEELGHGAFGKVCKGILKAPLSMKTGQSVNKTSKKIANSTITVAVKMLQGMWLWFLLTHKHDLRLCPHYTGEIWKQRFHSKTQQMFSVHTTPRKKLWKQRLHSENRANVFCPHYTSEKFENATVARHFGFVFEENSVREITWLMWRHRFWVLCSAYRP